MIYVIGNKVRLSSKGMWNEGNSYEKENIYSIIENKLPPVNYDLHKIKPHSLTHAESGKHTSNHGKTLDMLIDSNPEYFYGLCSVLKFQNDYKQIGENLYLKEITHEEIAGKISEVCGQTIPPKILITTSDYPIDENGYHAENYVLVLSEGAADYLCSLPDFHLFGTTWKSTDYQPGKLQRPIHTKIFSRGIVFELLNLNDVPEGKYIFSGMPLYLEDSSESPVTPILVSI
jgi:arylformamidase